MYEIGIFLREENTNLCSHTTEKRPEIWQGCLQFVDEDEFEYYYPLNNVKYWWVKKEGE